MVKSKGKKRKADELEVATTTSTESVDLPDGWVEKLLAFGPNLVYIIASLANVGQITTSQIKDARRDLPSLSHAKWSELAPNFDLPIDLTMARFDSFSIDPVLLPLSFHESIAGVAWRIQDVYQERAFQDREEAWVRVFDAYIIPIVGLFQGRIIDKPEHQMIPTAYSSGGEDQVEHELFMIGGILFFVIEMKLGYRRQNNVAQLFLELLSAAEMNKNAKFEGLRVHGLLTDLQAFHFYSYDQSQKKFAFDETLHASSATRETFIADMIPVTNKVFSIILFAYIEGLHASVEASRARPPTSPTGSSPAQRMVRKHNTPSGPRKSTEQWELALEFAMQCLDKFQEQFCTIEDVERQSCEAIALLTKSVRVIPRVSDCSGKEDPSTENELRTLARRVVRTAYMSIVGA